jgi:hypothetical protein
MSMVSASWGLKTTFLEGRGLEAMVIRFRNGFTWFLNVLSVVYHTCDYALTGNSRPTMSLLIAVIVLHVAEPRSAFDLSPD